MKYLDLNLAPQESSSWRDGTVALGLLLVMFAVLALLSPGRIDMIDGQFRFEVAFNLLHHGRVDMTDEALVPLGTFGPDGRSYGPYDLMGSLISVPLLAIAEWVVPSDIELAQFAFAMTSPLWAAATVALLFLIYRALGIGRGAALAWSAALGLATVFLPVATSVFGQAQHAFFVLLALFAAWRAGEARSWRWASVAAVSIICLINFSQSRIVLAPAFMAAAGWRPAQGAWRAFRLNWVVALVGISSVIGYGLVIAFNEWRFGRAIPQLIAGPNPSAAGNPVIGLLGLTISPGKGLLWYSPLVLGLILAWRHFRAAFTTLADAAATAIVIWALTIASISFYGGDWCWGPRYWVPVLPLAFLAAPWWPLSSAGQRAGLVALLLLSLLIQGLSVTVDHHRFFFERRLPAFFWAEDSSLYFKDSALLARPGEIQRAMEADEQRTFTANERHPFRPGPHPELLTYAPFGVQWPTKAAEIEWMNRYPAFTTWRPWPLWTDAALDLTYRWPRRVLLITFQAILLLGALTMWSGLRQWHLGRPRRSL